MGAYNSNKMECEKVKCNSCKCYRQIEDFESFKTCIKCRQKRQNFKKQHRDEENEKKKLYRERHRVELADKAKIYHHKLIFCEICNHEIKQENKAKHVKSVQHQNKLILKEIEDLKKIDINITEIQNDDVKNYLKNETL